MHSFLLRKKWVLVLKLLKGFIKVPLQKSCVAFELGCFSLENGRLRGRRTESASCCSPKQQAIGQNKMASKHGRFRLNITKYFLTGRVVKHWNRPAREVLESLNVEVFKTCRWGTYGLGLLMDLAVLGQKLVSMISEVLSNLNELMIQSQKKLVLLFIITLMSFLSQYVWSRDTHLI